MENCFILHWKLFIINRGSIAIFVLIEKEDQAPVVPTLNCTVNVMKKTYRLQSNDMFVDPVLSKLSPNTAIKRHQSQENVIAYLCIKYIPCILIPLFT